MDFETLHQILPKKTQIWSTQDISKWLEFINLPNLIHIFRDTGIDGSCIHLLDDQTLKTQLQISSPIIRKKLLNWVSIGLHGYDNYLNQSIKMSSYLPQRNLELKKSQTTHIRKQSRPKMANHEEVRSSEQHLILQQFEGNSLGFHIIKNQPMSIGFGKSNQIHSLQTSISQRHALIGRKNNYFYIQDLGSRYGTYIKINHRTLLRNNMILQIGSYQFVVIDINENNKTLKLKQIYLNLEIQNNQQNNKNVSNIQHGKNKGGKSLDISNNYNKNQNAMSIQKPSLQILEIDLKAKQKFTFGRRKQNDFQKEDKHMSGMHCKITFFNNSFYIQDYGSTNGTWHRLSPEYMTSIQYPIQHEMYIKLGTAITYICRLNNSTSNDPKNKLSNKLYDDNQMIDQNLCTVCRKQQNNCLFLPCSHNTCCIGCAVDLDQCTQCGHQIGDKIKIHK